MNLLELFAPIRTFIFDVDGVLTDGSLLLTDDGRMQRCIHARDSYAISLAIKKGYAVHAITEEKSEALSLWMSKTGIVQEYTGTGSKKELLQKIATASGTGYDCILFMGDDLPDCAAMPLCGLPCCPADAAAEVKQLAKYVSPFNGGKGCIRDVIEKVLKLNKDWESP